MRQPEMHAQHAPVHPHPLANDLADDDELAARSVEEEASADEGIGPAPRRVLRVVARIVMLLAMLALLVGALLIRESKELLLLAIAAVFLYFLALSAPIILAAGTKEAQDEAVRERRTAESDADEGALPDPSTGPERPE